jgi:hypothetical protein
VANATLADFEAGKRSPYNRTLADVRRALEDGGVDFLPDNGVRLKPRRTAPTRAQLLYHFRGKGNPMANGNGSIASLADLEADIHDLTLAAPRSPLTRRWTPKSAAKRYSLSNSSSGSQKA